MEGFWFDSSRATLWKFQASFILSYKNLGFQDPSPPPPLGIFNNLSWGMCGYFLQPHPGDGKDSLVKGSWMPVVPFREVRIWYHLGCFGQNTIIFSHQGIVSDCPQIASSWPGMKSRSMIVCFRIASFRGQIKLEPHPDWSPLGRGSIQVFWQASTPFSHASLPHLPPPPFRNCTLK